MADLLSADFSPGGPSSLLGFADPSPARLRHYPLPRWLRLLLPYPSHLWRPTATLDGLGGKAGPIENSCQIAFKLLDLFG